MSMFRWISKLFPFLAFLNVHKRYQRRASLLKLEAAKAYVLGIKKIRLFLLGALFVFFSLVLLASGLLLIHIALFSYSSWSAQMKFWMALALGCFEILAASAILYYLFSEETWVKFSGIKYVLNSVVKKKTES